MLKWCLQGVVGTDTLYDRLGGEETIRRLVAAFYPKVKADPLLGPLFPDDLTEIMEKQYLFLTQFFGGPPLYSERYGHPMMRARHLRFPIDRARADAWLACMRRAMEEIGVPEPARSAAMERLRGAAYHFVNC